MPGNEKPKKARMDLGELTSHNVAELKLINRAVFPVDYSEKFYKQAVQSGDFAKLAFYDDIIVGGVCCRKTSVDGVEKLYIMTLGCLAPYRRLGLGKLMLDHVMDLAQSHGAKQVYLHVQVSNDDAIEFYKRFGFSIEQTLKSYYTKIEPADAHVLVKNVDGSEEEAAPTEAA